jgi:hypothetical protein
VTYLFNRRAETLEAVFDPKPFRLNFVVDRSGSGTCFSPNAEGFPCQYHSTHLSYASSSKDCCNQDMTEKIGSYIHKKH